MPRTSPITLLALACLAAWHGQAAADGRRIYQEGLLPDGRALSGTVQNDVPLDAARLVCTGCHRRSGLGSSEGGVVVPPVTGDILFAPRTIEHRGLYAQRTSGSGTRPAYTDETLARAIREGVDAAGRPLDRLMPRYALSDEEVAALIGHLKTLSSNTAVGVEGDAIHFATVTSDRLAPERESALLGLMRAFFADKNAQTRQETQRAEHAPWHKERIYPAYRRWELHHWRLTGAPEGWPAQLEAHYRERPVFALLGGNVAGAWAPIHAFAEAHAIPTVLPHTEQPAAAGYYTLYPSEGMALRARAIARDLAAAPARKVLQLFDGSGPGAAGAAALRAHLPGATVEEIDLTSPAAVAELAARMEALRPDAVVLWRNGSETLPADPPRHPVERLYIVEPGLALPRPAQVTLFTPQRTYTAYPYALEQEAQTRHRRLHYWLDAKGLTDPDPLALADAYLALTATGEVLMHMRTYFSRDYFIERLEHTLSRATLPAFYPRISLAPGQRFAAKGCYLVELGPDGSALEARWVVP